MRKQVIGVVMALMLAMPSVTVIAAPKSPKLARCDGHHRRTANPYGSILPTVDPQTGTSTPAGQTPAPERDHAGVEIFPGKTQAPAIPAKPAGRGNRTAPQVPPISSAQPQRSFESC
jgi:hypothetical protein